MTPAQESLCRAIDKLQGKPGAAASRSRPGSSGAAAFVHALTALIDERIHLAGVEQEVAASVVSAQPRTLGLLLSAQELADKLELSVQSVRNLERDGKLFSLISPHRKRGRLYPSFFAWPGVSGAILKGLKGLPNTYKYEFLTSPNAQLEGLSPLVVWTAKAGLEGVNAAQSELLRRDAKTREAAVHAAATRALSTNTRPAK
jgi:hypothetical protein